MSPKKTGNNSPPCYSCTFFEFSRPRAAARGTALRAVKVLTSCQTLPEPLTATHGNTRQHIAACHLQMRIHASTHTHARIETNTETETEIDTDADTDTDTDANIDIDTRHRTQTDIDTETEKQAKTDMQTDRQTDMYPQARTHTHTTQTHAHEMPDSLCLSVSLRPSLSQEQEHGISHMHSSFRYTSTKLLACLFKCTGVRACLPCSISASRSLQQSGSCDKLQTPTWRSTHARPSIAAGGPIRCQELQSNRFCSRFGFICQSIYSGRAMLHGIRER